MSTTSQTLFDGLRAAKRAAIAAVPSFEHFGSDLQREGSRMVTLGAMELASMLFSGHGFCLYGPGQRTPPREHTSDLDPTREAEHERSGMDR